MSPTVNRFGGEWANLQPATTGLSHRSTTSSRRPGKTIEGNVAYEIARTVRCGDCGFIRRASLHPHGPHFNADGRRVDCAGREVAP